MILVLTLIVLSDSIKKGVLPGLSLFFSYTAFAINHTSLMFWQYTMYNVMYNCTSYNIHVICIHGKWGVQDRMSSSPLLKQCAFFQHTF